MDNLFLFLFIISSILLIIGLAKPDLFVCFLKEQVTRKRIVIIFGISAVVFFILFGIITELSIQTLKTTQENKISEKVEDNKQVVKIEVIPEIIDYNIEFIANHKGGRSFEIKGNTNLPNNSKISITIYDKDYFEHDNDDFDWRMENLTYIQSYLIVNNGKFKKIIEGEEMNAPLKSKTYTVEIGFDPRFQNNYIKKIVGENGEYISGQFLNSKIENLNMIEITTMINLSKEIAYKIVNKEDMSYSGCKRTAIRIVVPDNSDKIGVEIIMKKIIDENKSKWNDITVWAYKYSEKSMVGEIGYTMGMKEYSTCN